MKLSEKQAIVMQDVLKWSLQVVGGVAGYKHEFLQELYFQIMNQQNEELVELD